MAFFLHSLFLGLVFFFHLSKTFPRKPDKRPCTGTSCAAKQDSWAYFLVSATLYEHLKRDLLSSDFKMGI